MEKRFRSITPLILLIAVNLVGLWIITNRSDAQNEMLMLSLGMCVLSIIVYMVINFAGLGDPYLYIIVSMLSTVGIVMLSRIDLANGDTLFGTGQMKMYLGGVVVFFVMMLAYRGLYKKLPEFLPIYFLGSVGLYIITLVVGTATNGAKNWIKIGEFSLQPSEFIKILFVLSLAAALTKNIPKKEKPKKKTSKIEDKPEKVFVSKPVKIATAIAYINALFLFLQTEWGTAVLLFAIYLAFLFIYDEKPLFLGVNILLIAIVVFFGMKIEPHIQERVTAWLDPYSDSAGLGYQVVVSLIAIKDGGFRGAGIGNGIPYMIPEVESDAIFPAICEEMGMLGGIAVLMLYFVLVYRGFKIALSTTNQFNKAVSMGISVMLGVQTFIIVGGITKLIPLTGITLPFISHGGSSMISTFIAIGILQGISSIKEEITDEIE